MQALREEFVYNVKAGKDKRNPLPRVPYSREMETGERRVTDSAARGTSNRLFSSPRGSNRPRRDSRRMPGYNKKGGKK